MSLTPWKFKMSGALAEPQSFPILTLWIASTARYNEHCLNQDVTRDTVSVLLVCHPASAPGRCDSLAYTPFPHVPESECYMGLLCAKDPLDRSEGYASTCVKRRSSGPLLHGPLLYLRLHSLRHSPRSSSTVALMPGPGLRGEVSRRTRAGAKVLGTEHPLCARRPWEPPVRAARAGNCWGSTRAYSHVRGLKCPSPPRREVPEVFDAGSLVARVLAA